MIAILLNTMCFSHKTITESFIKDLAVKYQFTTGKWFIPVERVKSDDSWKRLVQGLVHGRFPDDLGVLCIRIHDQRIQKKNPPPFSHPHKSPNSAMISICVEDWPNESARQRITKICKSLGLGLEELSYKPQIKTELKIYKGNPYDMTPSISKFD